MLCRRFTLIFPLKYSLTECCNFVAGIIHFLYSIKLKGARRPECFTDNIFSALSLKVHKYSVVEKHTRRKALKLKALPREVASEII